MQNARTLALTSIIVSLCGLATAATAVEISRTLEPGQTLSDPRLGKQRDLYDKDHPWKPAATKDEWDKQSQAIRERVLVSAGLWPMPPKEPLTPVVHGKIDRGAYTVEKVFFASYPGHYVTGSLYRPAKSTGKVPGVLCPHGHWQNGRFYDAGPVEAQNQLKQGGEATMAGARYPLQARMAELARLGCVVFHYDMVGVADSKPIGHREGFTDAEADLRLQSFLGLQTFNSIRALDFLLSLPDVDANRIGVTAASGGGTQTFILCAIDPRPTVAFPAVMVSTDMQGGCVCENAELLRVGINNVAIAAVFAPKPQAMSGAHDWTIDIERKGLPELKQIYGLYGAADKVHAKCFPQFGHNYNRVSRELMYNWFNQHLDLGKKSPIVEEDFWPLSPKELSVFDENHPRPADSKTAPQLRAYLTEIAEKQFADLVPKDAAGVERYRNVVGTAARVMLTAALPEPSAIGGQVDQGQAIDDRFPIVKGIARRSDDGTQFPWIAIQSPSPNGTAVLWLDGQGKSHLFESDGKLKPGPRKLLEAGNTLVSADLMQTGELRVPGQTGKGRTVDRKYAAFTFGYNPTLMANRVHDVLSAVAGVKKTPQLEKIKLVGTGDAGPCVLLAAAFLRGQVDEVIADAGGLSYQKLPATTDPTFLPGALKYGGLGGLAALAAPTNLAIYGAAGIPSHELAPLSSMYKVAGGSLKVEAKPLSGDLVVERLTSSK